MESMSYIKGQLILSKQILNILPSALIFMDAMVLSSASTMRLSMNWNWEIGI